MSSPTAEEMREYLKAHDLTGAAAAKLVQVNPRTFRRYTSHTAAQAVPYAVWFTLRTKVDNCSVQEDVIDGVLDHIVDDCDFANEDEIVDAINKTPRKY